MTVYGLCIDRAGVGVGGVVGGNFHSPSQTTLGPGHICHEHPHLDGQLTDGVISPLMMRLTSAGESFYAIILRVSKYDKRQY